MLENDYPYLAVLCQLEEYIPYMLAEEIIYIIFIGSIPSPESLTRWEIMRVRDERKIEQEFTLAASRQREKLAKNLQMDF